MHGWGLFFLLLFLALIFGAAGWIFWTRSRAQRSGLPPPPLTSYIPFYRGSGSATNYPTPRPSHITDWFKDTLARLRNKRSARGAYEEPQTLPGGRARGTRGLDPDEAWDTRVGNEADAYGPGPGGYYEEQELGLHGGRSNINLPTYGQGEVRAHSATREPEAYIGGGPEGLDRRYDEEMGYGAARGREAENPFGDAAEPSQLRAVSPRPAMHDRTVSRETMGSTLSAKKKGSLEESPTERRSMFREGL